jgi:hypothetical protein
MPNIIGAVDHPDNPDWAALQFDDGSQSPWAQDPDGSFRAAARDTAAKLQGRPALPNTAPPTAAETAGLQPTAGELASLQGRATPNVIDMDALEPLVMTSDMSRGSVAPAVMMTSDNPGSIAPLSAGRAPLPSGAPPSAAETNRLAPNAADLAGIRRGLGDVTHGRAAPAAAAPMGASYGGTPRMAMNGADVSSKGYAPEDKARIDAANAEAVAKRGEANTADLQARNEQLNAEWARLSGEQKAKLAEKAAAEEQERKFTAHVDAQVKANQDIASRKIDPSEAFKGEAGFYAFMAAIGDGIQNFGAALAGHGPVANPGATIDRMMQRSIDQQTEQRTLEFKQGQITADQLNADREHVRLKIATVGKQLVENQLAKAKTQDEKIGLQALAKKFDADQADSIAKNAQATATEQQRRESYAPVVVKPAEYTNDTIRALDLIGVTPKAYAEGMNSTIGKGDGAQTYNQAVQNLAELDSDIKLLDSLAKANGGTLPQKGVLRIPEALVPTAARLGLKDGMEAEAANQLVYGVIMKRAKSYGASVTESDIDNAKKETGTSTEGLRSFMTRQHSQLNNQVRQGLDTLFPGRGQEVLNVSRNRFQQTRGVPLAEGVEPFEVQNAQPADEAPRELSDVEQRQAQNRARAKQTFTSIFKSDDDAPRAPTAAYRGKF